MDDTYHAPCGHWGPQTNSSPCAIGYSNSTFLRLGCHNKVTEGCIRVDAICFRCKFKKQEEPKKALERAVKQQRAEEEAERKRLLEIEEEKRKIIRDIEEEDMRWLQEKLDLHIDDTAWIERTAQDKRRESKEKARMEKGKGVSHGKEPDPDPEGMWQNEWLYDWPD